MINHGRLGTQGYFALRIALLRIDDVRDLKVQGQIRLVILGVDGIL